MADPSHGHDLKTELRNIQKEAEHEKNVKEKHHGHHHEKPTEFPKLQHQLETGKIEVMSADGKVTEVARETITTHPPQH